MSANNDEKNSAATARKERKPVHQRLLDRVLSPFAEELRRRYPDAYAKAISGKGLIPTLSAHPDITINGKKFWQAYDEAEQALENRAPLKVKPGDFVCILGRFFRIGHVDAHRRQVATERVGDDGRVISSDWCDADFPDGTMLEPIAGSGLEASDWPPIPDTMTDAHSRARFVARAHALHLVRAGLADDDDD